MLVDEAEITIKGGHGGPGIVSFGKGKKSGPDGGNGGRGGDLYLMGSSDLTLLNQFLTKTLFEAENGESGGRNRKTGKSGKDLEIRLPVGTSVIDIRSGKKLAEIEKEDQKVLICKGGKGGRGNYEFRSPKRTTPRFAQPGLPGEEYDVKVVLKLIADFGLVGLPNAGKSSLLNELTNAKAKIANYAFTTLSPNLGVLNGKILADIPGLIEGASEGKGLGFTFLKHIEKVKVLLHCISSESTNPIDDYQAVRKELKNYKKALVEKPEIVLITKSDLVDKKTLKSLKDQFKTKNIKALYISIHDWDSIKTLKNELLNIKY